MKRKNNVALTLIVLATLTFGSGTVRAGHHWGNGPGMQGYPLTTQQQTAAQKLHNDFYVQTSALRQQLMSKRYEYNALLTTDKPDGAKIEAVAQEIDALREKLDQQRVKFDIAMAQAGIPRGMGTGRGGCSGGGHSGMGRW